MARRPRLDLDGFHHIINCGVARNNIYKCDEDKEKFLEILCKSCHTYKVNIHDYCLMDSHFKNNKDLPSRNSAMIEALKDGYTQGEIARYLGVSAALVSYVFRSFND